MAVSLPVIGTSASDPTKTFNGFTAILGIITIFWLFGKVRKVIGL
jgi:hypothetical protein